MLDSGSMFQLSKETDKLNKRIIKPILKSFTLNKFELSDCINLRDDEENQDEEMRKFLDNQDEDIKILDLMRNQRIDIQLRVTKRDFLPKIKSKDGIRRSSITSRMKSKLDNIRNKEKLNSTGKSMKTSSILNPLYEPSAID